MNEYLKKEISKFIDDEKERQGKDIRSMLFRQTIVVLIVLNLKFVFSMGNIISSVIMILMFTLMWYDVLKLLGKHKKINIIRCKLDNEIDSPEYKTSQINALCDQYQDKNKNKKG